MDLKKRQDENEEQYIWRLGQAKDKGLIDLDWTELADVINKNCREDDSEYRNESAYRKPYQQTRRFFEAGVFEQYYKNDSYIDEITEAKHELRKEKQRLFDERTALNKILREQGRAEEDLSKLAALIKENGKTTMPKPECVNVDSDNDLIICLSDFHLGMNIDNYFGEYNSDIAIQRLQKYLNEIIRLQELYNAENAHLILLGDILSGNIHFGVQLQNRENVVEQVQKSAEYISAFAYELSKHFKKLYINGVAGNHSRVGYKDTVLRDERMDNLIPWYMKAKLAHLSNIEFLDDYNFDASIGRFYVKGNEYWCVHGDYDKFTESGLSKLILMLGHAPRGVFFGHLHHCSYDSIADISLVRSGCFSGAIDDYTISKRISGKPSQMVCVADENGIKSFHPVMLS